MVEERRHGARAMMRQRGELLDEGRVGRRVGREVPRRVVEDGAVAFLATQGRDVPKRGVHRVTLGVVQRQPDRAQRVGLGLRQRGNVEIGEHAAGVEIAGQQTVRHLPEEVAGGVVARHRISARPTRASRRTDRNTRRSAVMSDSQRRVAFPPTAAARRHFLLATPTRGSERDRGEVQRSIWVVESPDPWLTPPALNPSASCGRARCSFSCTVGRQEQANSNLLRSSTLLRCPSY